MAEKGKAKPAPKKPASVKKAAKFVPKKRVKAGTSKAAAVNRKKLFVNAYLENGQNGTQAAVTAGYKPGRAAEKAAERLSKDVVVHAELVAGRAELEKISGLSVARTLREVARLAYSDPRKLFNKDGKAIPIHELDDDTAATLASVEVEENFEGHGEDRELIGFTKKIKVWDKNAALEKAMKHFGQYGEDNKQRAMLVIKDLSGRG